MPPTPTPEKIPTRIGHGFDIHRLAPLPPAGKGRPLRLAGVPIESPTGPIAHSDGDAVCHAITDAILGALTLPDIGQMFPNTDPAHEGADSTKFLKAATRLMTDAGYTIGNLDITIICQHPKIAPHKPAMIASLTTCLDCDRSQINIKGKTHEGVDAVGEGKAIEVHAVVLLIRIPSA